MQKRRAILVHINPMEGVTPLAGGYLKTYAELEPTIRESWDIDLYSTTTDCPASTIIQDLFERAPDVVGFSTYVWNIGLIQRMLPALRGVLPAHTQFLLGGVQVMNSAEDYVDRRWDNVSVCNGEGEKTFRQYLLEILSDEPDFSRIGGLTFVRNSEFVTTESHPRIKDLDEIPSPYLAGVFDRKDLSIALVETNRGCPYKCEYCFWGGAIGQKINRMDVNRIHQEIDYLASQRCRAVLICDANFGIFPQDADTARHFVESKDKTGYPLRVTYSSAKNNPERALEVATILAQGGVLSSQPISLQTMNPRALEIAKRGNISSDAYLQLQQRMNEIGVASFIELIWPLPGETLDSFKQGIHDLCEMGAQVFGVYPLLWLKNVGYEGKEEELGIVTLDEADPVGGGRIAIQTRDVSFEEWVDGMVYANSVMLLYDCRGLYHTAGILNSLGLESYRDLFDRFVAWMADAESNRVVDLWHRGQGNFEEMYKFTWRGAVVESVLHSGRSDFDAMMMQFANSMSDLFSGDHQALLEASVEFDILSRPYAYANTPFAHGAELRHIEVIEESGRERTVRAPFNFVEIHRQLASRGCVSDELLQPEAVEIAIDHRRGQIFRMPYRRDEDHFQFCHQFVTEIGNNLPLWKTSSGISAVEDQGV